MIPRSYFYRCTAEEGTVIGVVALRSWWPDPVQAIQEAKAQAAQHLDIPAADVRLEAFYRL